MTRYRDVEPRRYSPAAIVRYRQTPVRIRFEDTDDFRKMVPLTGLEPVTPALRRLLKVLVFSRYFNNIIGISRLETASTQ